MPVAAVGLLALLAPGDAQAQVAAASVGGRPSLYAGGFYSNFNSDFQNPRIQGLGLFVDWNTFGHLGVEGEARFLRLDQINGFHSDHYLAGPRYSLRYGNLRPYAKFLIGGGELTFPSGLGHGGYFAMAPGIGVDYRLTRRFSARADYEYQIWPSAPGLPGAPSNGLTPNGYSFGVAYRIF